MYERPRLFGDRCGMDPLNITLLLLAAVLAAVGQRWRPVLIPAGAVFAVMVFRALSKNYEKRGRENRWMLERYRKLLTAVPRWQMRWRDRAWYKYFRCPECGELVRVPKGKGKLRITCPHCRAVFYKKT